MKATATTPRCCCAMSPRGIRCSKRPERHWRKTPQPLSRRCGRRRPTSPPILTPAITAVGILAWAYHVVLNRTEDAIRAAENACRRFPKRADAHLMLAQLRLASARQREGQGVEASGQYKEAARAAVEARDLFHSWEGPSGTSGRRGDRGAAAP